MVFSGYMPSSGIAESYGSSIFSFLFIVRWMDLESVIQSEVSEKEKNKYRMLTHIYGIQKKKKWF